MDKIAVIEAKKIKANRLERILALAVSALIVVVGLTAGFFIFKYVSERNAPPTTYYDYQLRLWRASLDKSPKDPAIHTNIGYIYMKMGNPSKGLAYFNQALALDKKFVPALYNIGMYHKKSGNSKEAIAYLNKAGENAVKGNKYLAYFSLGELYYEAKDYDKAIEHLKKSLDDNATIWNSHEKLGDIYLLKGDKAQAIESFKKAMSFNPSNEKLKAKIERLTSGNAASSD